MKKIKETLVCILDKAIVFFGLGLYLDNEDRLSFSSSNNGLDDKCDHGCMVHTAASDPYTCLRCYRIYKRKAGADNFWWRLPK